MQPSNNSQVQSNKNNFFGIRVSTPGINVNNATDSQLQYLNNYNQEIFFANGAANVLIGERSANTLNGLTNAEEGFFVAQQGTDVRNATDDQLIFNSNQETFRIVQSGSETVPDATYGNDDQGFTSLVIPHNLGYIPIFQVYVFVYVVIGPAYNFIQTYTQLPIIQGVSLPEVYENNGTAAYLEWSITAAADTTNLYITQFFKTTDTGAGDIGEMPLQYYLIQPNTL